MRATRCAVCSCVFAFRCSADRGSAGKGIRALVGRTLSGELRLAALELVAVVFVGGGELDLVEDFPDAFDLLLDFGGFGHGSCDEWVSG